jgi:hypothetical protein
MTKPDSTAGLELVADCALIFALKTGLRSPHRLRLLLDRLVRSRPAKT